LAENANGKNKKPKGNEKKSKKKKSKKKEEEDDDDDDDDIEMEGWVGEEKENVVPPTRPRRNRKPVNYKEVLA
jgi:hypothetical protein